MISVENEIVNAIADDLIHDYLITLDKRETDLN